MQVSVIIPTRDRHELLAQAVASVPGDHEVIVVDDASVSPVTVNRPHARVLRNPVPVGPAAARNRGIQAAGGTWIGFCDDDDRWEPGRVVPVTGADVVVYGSVDSRGGRARTRPFDADTVLDYFTPHLGRTLVRRDKCPRFDERYTAIEDVEWWLRLAATCSVTFEESIGYWYRFHDTPRQMIGIQARIRCSRQLLDEHAAYFAAHRRARGFRQLRLAQMLAATGDRRRALPLLLKAAFSRRDVHALHVLIITLAMSAGRKTRPVGLRTPEAP